MTLQNSESCLIKVFVYGTLKPGEANYESYCAAEVVETKRAIALGHLFDLPFGYPAMTTGESQVHGFLLSFSNSAVLAQLDSLEGYDPSRSAEQNEYNRVPIKVYHPAGQPLDTAWAYFMTAEQVKHLGGVLLSAGWWSNCGIPLDMALQ